METIHHITTPAGQTYEIEDTTAREQSFEPMDNFEINEVLNDIFE